MWFGDGSAHAMATPAVEIKNTSKVRSTVSVFTDRVLFRRE